jgi:hypothetical protein
MKQLGLGLILAFALLLPRLGWTADRAGAATGVQGRVEVSRNGQWRPVWREDPIFVGDRLRTGADGRVALQFVDGSLLTLSPNGNLEITKYIFSSRSSIVNLWMGRLRAVITKSTSTAKTDYKFITSTAVAGVRGTDLVLTVMPAVPGQAPEATSENAPQKYKTELAVLEGDVAFSSVLDNAGPEIHVLGGHVSETSYGKGPSEAHEISGEQRSQYQRASLAPGRGNGQPQFAHDFDGNTGGGEEGGPSGGNDVLTTGGSGPADGPGGNSGGLPPINQQPGSVGGKVPVSVEIRHVQ